MSSYNDIVGVMKAPNIVFSWTRPNGREVLINASGFLPPIGARVSMHGYVDVKVESYTWSVRSGRSSVQVHCVEMNS